jgi:hypothetical protein
MITTLEVFKKGLEDLSKYIEILKLQSEAVKSLLGSAEHSPPGNYAKALAVFPARRRYEYICTIIILYGLLEQFIEALLEAYVLEINSTVGEYKKLPKAFTNIHYELTLGHLSRATHKQYRGIASPQILVNNLNDCLQNHTPYKITAESFIHHTANFRRETIDEFFHRVGIHGICRQSVLTDGFKNFVESLHPPRVIPNNQPESVLQEIDDLADRRNEVAHGAVSNTLSLDLLAEYVNITRHFGFALYEVVADELAGYKVNHKGVLLGKPIQIFNHNIVCINTKGYEIKNLDYLVIKTKDRARPFRLAQVRSIQINGQDVDSTPKGKDVLVGLKVDRRAKKTYDIFYCSKV